MKFRTLAGAKGAFGRVRLALFFLLVGLLPLAAPAQGIFPPPAAAPELRLRVTGTVEVIVPYGSGYVVGGNFDQINGEARRNIALVDANGALADGGFDAGWASSGANATVSALAVSGDDVFVGGGFTAIGGQSRSYLAKVSLLDGSVDAAFQPVLDDAVRAIALDVGRGQVFAGGLFLAANGAPRERAAKFDAADGSLVTGWSPGYNDAAAVNVLLFDAVADRLYVGGKLRMTQSGGHNRGIGRLLGGTGARDTAWTVGMHPKGGAEVWTLAMNATHVYLGGQFGRIGNTNRNHIARVAVSDAALDSGWNPNADAPVRKIVQDGTGLLVGGDFSTIGGATRLRLARLVASGAADGAFSADADRPVRTIVPSGTDAIVGGAFRFLGGDTEEGIARIVAATGARDAGFAGAAGGPGRINAFAIDGNGGVIAGGEFDFVEQAGDANVYPRGNMLRLNPDFSLDTGWMADVSGDVQAMAIAGNDLYIGGSFLQVTNPVGGAATARTRLARYDVSGATPSLSAWTPAANGDVTELVADADGIYAAGLFSTLGGSVRAFVGRLDPATGAAHAWSPDPDGPVHALVSTGSEVYLGGDFSLAGGAARANLARVDDSAGADTAALAADTDAAVRAMALDGSLLYLGGEFALVQGAALAGAARLDTVTATIDASWNPSIPGSVQALAFDGVNGWIYFGGQFASAGGMPHPDLARASTADPAGEIDHAWRPGTDGTVSQVAGLATNDVLVAGAFASVTNETRGAIARLGPDGSDATATSIDSITPEPSAAGQDWTVSFTVANSSGGSTPTGSVAVSTDFGESCGPVALDGAGQGSCIINSTLAGDRVVTASYTADAPGLMDSATTAAHSVVAAAPEASNPGTLIEVLDGAALTDGIDAGLVRVTLLDAFDNPVAGATVAFSVTGNAVLGTPSGVTDADGQISTTVTDTTAETVDVTAAFDSDGNATTDTAVANGSPAQVTFTGTVDAGNAGTLVEALDDVATADGIDTGAVRLTLVDGSGNPVPGIAVSFAATGSASLATPAGTTDANGQFGSTLTDTVVEVVDVTAMFDADDDGTPDTAVVNGSPAQVAFVSQAIATTTAIAGDAPDASVVGQPYTVSFEVSASSAPVGTVVVSDGAGAMCSDTLEAGDNGLGSCNLASTSAGPRTLTASFAGSGDFEDSVSAGEPHTVDPAATSLGLSADPTIITEGDTVTFSWSLSVVAPGAGSPTGMVTVSEVGGLTCSASLAAGSCDITINTAGNYDFNGSYSGDADFLGDTDGPVAVDVQLGGPPTTDIVVRHEIERSAMFVDGSADLVDYELEVTNTGAATADDVFVSMPMPIEFSAISWTCTPSGGASCDQLAAGGNGDISGLVDLPGGASVLLEISVTLTDPDDNGVETFASAEPPGSVIDPEPGNNSAVTFYRRCSASEVVGGGPLPAHLCRFRDGFEARD